MRNDFAHSKEDLDFASPGVDRPLKSFFRSESVYLAAVWKLLMGNGTVSLEDNPTAIEEDALRFVEEYGARKSFELIVAHVTAALEHAVESGTVEQLTPLSDDRSY